MQLKWEGKTKINKCCTIQLLTTHWPIPSPSPSSHLPLPINSSPFSPPNLCTSHDILWYWICLWDSCPGCAPSQILSTWSLADWKTENFLTKDKDYLATTKTSVCSWYYSHTEFKMQNFTSYKEENQLDHIQSQEFRKAFPVFCWLVLKLYTLFWAYVRFPRGYATPYNQTGIFAGIFKIVLIIETSSCKM